MRTTHLTQASCNARLLQAGLFVMLCAMLVFQGRSLFVFPQPNGLRWFGDETWLMSEAHAQISEGVVRYPLAVGTPLFHAKGIVLGMTWLSALLYGLPTLIFRGDIVAIGRIVTFVLGLTLLNIIYRVGRKWSIDPVAILFALILLVGGRAFFFASHSCRTDILAGLIVTAVVLYFEGRWRSGNRAFEPRGWLLFGIAMTALGLTSSIHLLTLLLPLSLYYLWRFGGLRSLNAVGSAVLGSLLCFGLLVGIYVLTTHSHSLFGQSSGNMQFQDVLHDVPIFRPLSRSVQFANIAIRYHFLLDEAPAFLAILVVLAAFALAKRFSKRENPLSESIGIPLVIVIMSWLLLSGAQVTYAMHVLPLLTFAFALTISPYLYRTNGGWLRLGIIIVTIATGTLCIRDSTLALANGTRIANSNRDGIGRIASTILSEANREPRPRVVVEPPALDGLSQYASLDVVTDHFISFPERDQSLEEYLRKNGIRYLVLYNSPCYPKNRPLVDSFYIGVKKLTIPTLTVAGMSGDMGRNYFGDPDTFQDTLLLFKVRD